MKKFKTLLIVPNLRLCTGDQSTFWHFIPYNLCLLASMIKDLCEVKIIDAYADNLSEINLENILYQENADLVGITVMMDQFADAGHITANIVKKISPDTQVVMGGVYVTVAQEEVMENVNIDYTVIGEGEYTFRSLIDYFLGNNKSLPEKGICYRKRGEVINTGRSDFINDLDALPFPSYDLIDYSKYSTNFARKSVGAPKKYPYARLFTSRGCPFECCFCQVKHIAGRRFRSRSSESILNEIEWLHKKYDVQCLIFDDDNLFTDRKRALSLFNGMVDRGLNMPWASISTAVFKLDKDLMELMKASGCYFLNIAIESGSQRVLDEIVRKPINFQHAIDMVKMAKNVGIYIAANFIVGFPTETWDEILETIQFAEKLNVDYVKIFHAIPLRKTELWELCVKHKAFKRSFNVEKIRWSSGQIESQEFNSNDLTILRAYEWDRINFTDSRKRQRTALEMGVTENDLFKIRKKTLLGAQKNI